MFHSQQLIRFHLYLQPPKFAKVSLYDDLNDYKFNDKPL